MRLIDCTLRDGGNLNNWKFSTDDIVRIVGHLDAAGVDVIEVGYRGGSGSKRDKDVGVTADVSTSLLTELPARAHADLAVMAVPTVCPVHALDDLIDTPVRWIRVAVYPQDVDLAFPFIEHLKRRGHQVGMNLMAATYATPYEVVQVAKRAVSAGADMFYIADSFGAMGPDQVTQYIGSLRASTDVDIGFHGHNNLGLAFLNAHAAKLAGASCLDSSLCGMARGAGNLVTEQVVASADWFLPGHRGNVNDALSAAELVFAKYMRDPMPVRRPEIECGLGNVHYYSYGDFQKITEQYGIDRLRLMLAVSEAGKVKYPIEDIERVAKSMREVV